MRDNCCSRHHLGSSTEPDGIHGGIASVDPGYQDGVFQMAFSRLLPWPTFFFELPK
jgi:hypothetical protein